MGMTEARRGCTMTEELIRAFWWASWLWLFISAVLALIGWFMMALFKWHNVNLSYYLISSLTVSPILRSLSEVGTQAKYHENQNLMAKRLKRYISTESTVTAEGNTEL